MSEAEPNVQGVTETAFGLWRQHPCTRLVMQLLVAKGEFLKETVLGRFITGDLGLGDDEGQCLRGQIIEIEELLNLGFAEVHAFFQVEGDQDDAQRISGEEAGGRSD